MNYLVYLTVNIYLNSYCISHIKSVYCNNGIMAMAFMDFSGMINL